jgi:hypothetical protein
MTSVQKTFLFRLFCTPEYTCGSLERSTVLNSHTRNQNTASSVGLQVFDFAAIYNGGNGRLVTQAPEELKKSARIFWCILHVSARRSTGRSAKTAPGQLKRKADGHDVNVVGVTGRPKPVVYQVP